MKFSSLNLRDLKIGQPSFSVSADFQQKLKLLAIPALSVVISILLLLVVARPKVEQIIQLRGQVKEQSEKVDSMGEKADKLTKLNRSELEAKAKLINKAIPVSKDVAGAVIGLEKMAAESGLVITSLSLSPGAVATESAEFGQLDISLSADGSFSQLRSFISKIGQALRIFNIRSLTVKVLSETDFVDPPVSANFGISVYFAPVQKSTGAVDRPLPELTKEEERILVKLSEYQSVTDVPVPVFGSTNSAILESE